MINISKTVTFTAAFFVTSSIWSQNAPSFMLVNKIEENASYLGQLDREPFESGDAETGTASAASDRASQCLKDIEKFSKATNAGDQKFKIKFHVKGSWEPEERELSLDEVTNFVTDYYALARLSKLRRDLEQDLMRCLTWFEDLSNESNKLDLDQLEVARDAGKTLQKRLKDVKNMGLEQKVNLNVYNKDYNYNQLHEIADFTAAAGGKQYDKAMESKMAKDKPFLDKLTGDKKDTFKSEFAGNSGMWECLGSGGRALTTPEQLASASVWYTWGNSTDALISTWHITGYVFNGDKLVKTTSKRGIGLKPSSANFK